MFFYDTLFQLMVNKKYILDNGDTVLHAVLANNDDEAANEYLVEILPLLSSEVINHQSKGVTALFYACYKGYYQCIKTLLENKADVNIQHKNKSGRIHPVIYVLDKFSLEKEKQTELLKLFIEYGLCPYDLNDRGDSLLHLTVYDNKELFMAAYNYQKNHNVMNKNNESPLDIYFCCNSELEDLLWMLKNTKKHMFVTKGIKNTPCHYLSALGNKPVLGYICNNFPEFNKQNAKKQKPRKTLDNHKF